MSQLLTSVFKVDALQARLSELAALIRPAITDPAAVKNFDGRVAQMRDWIARRAASLGQQLKAR